MLVVIFPKGGGKLLSLLTFREMKVTSGENELTFLVSELTFLVSEVAFLEMRVAFFGDTSRGGS